MRGQEKELMSVLPWVTTIGLGIYVAWQSLRPKMDRMNPDIQKDEKKVAHIYDVEDVGEKLSLCRCWRSKTFPLCDGAHKAYNKTYGDNVGPVKIVRKKVA